jgi:thiamine-monophosphate kinase
MPTSEFDLIAAITERLPSPAKRLRVASGDDAAVVEPAETASVVTVDAMVEGVHFTLPEFPGEAVGRKALAAALSDLAAMGAIPGEAYVALGAPAEAPDELLLAIADGIAEVAGREGVSIGGGDLVGAPAVALSVTAVGYEPKGSRLVTREGASPGDVVAVTGELGGAAAAITLLQPGRPAGEGGGLTDAVRDRLIARQLDPRPQLAPGRALAAAGATAMIDVSDGLGADAAHLAGASGCRLEIDLPRLPLADGVAAVAGDAEAALELAAGGGEDFELLATLPPDRIAEARSAVAQTGSELTEIGYAGEGGGVTLRRGDGSEVEPRGFDHRRGSRSGSSPG